MTMSLLLEHFDGLLATSEDVENLNVAIVQLALQGKLALQDSSEEPASELLKRIVRSDGDKDIPVIDIASLQLPKNWSAEYLGVIAEQITKGSTPTTYGFQFQSEGIRFVKVENVKNGRIVLENIKDFISEEANRAQLRSQLQAGDVLFSIAGTIGETCVVKLEDLPANTNQALAIIRGTQIIFDPKFLKLQLDSFVANAIKGRARGGAMNNVSLGDLRQLLVFIPPLAEQQRIVARVEELFAQTRALAKELDHSQVELDGLNKSALSQLLASEAPGEFNQHWDFIAEHFDLLFQAPEHVMPLRQSILELAVRGKLTRREAGDESAKQLLNKIKEEKNQKLQSGELRYVKEHGASLDELPFEIRPEWVWCKAQDLFYVQSGNAFKSQDFTTRGIRLVRNVNIGHGSLTWNDTAFIPAEQEIDYEKFRLNQGDILISLDRPLITTGLKVAQVSTNDLPSLLVQRVGRVVFWSNQITLRYVYFWFLTSLFMDSIDPGRSKGIPHISQNDITKLVIPLPPLAEQERIVKRVEQLLSLCDALEARLQSAEDERGRLVSAVMSTVGG